MVYKYLGLLDCAMQKTCLQAYVNSEGLQCLPTELLDTTEYRIYDWRAKAPIIFCTCAG